jgi:hypothetical protein
MNRRVPLAALLASLPLVVFVLLAFAGIGSIGLGSMSLGLTLGVPFWLFLVLPVYLLSDRGRRWSIWISVLLSYAAVAALYVAYAWTPSAYTLVVGGKVLVEHGVATKAYYTDLLAHIAAAGVAVLLGAPVFARLVVSRPPKSSP